MAMTVLLLYTGVVVVLGGVCAPPLSETSVKPKDVAQSAVDVYNQQTSTDVVFKFLQLRNVKRKTFHWGVHFSINFTIKETECRKPAVLSVQDCKHGSSGKMKDCFVEATVLHFPDDAPLTSVQCHPQQQVAKRKPPASLRKKKKTTKKHQPAVSLAPPEPEIQYYISSYSTAALMQPEEVH